MTTPTRPAIAVVYDVGAATAAEILDSLVPDHRVVAVLSPSAHAQALRDMFAEECAAVLDRDDPDLAGRLTALGVAGIVTFSERMLATTAGIAASTGLRHHTPEVVANVTDKAAQRRALRHAGVDEVRSAVLPSLADWPDVADRVGMPAVVKPANGESSRNTRLVHDAVADRDTVARLLASEGRLVVEEYLRGAPVPDGFGDYLSVESAVLPTGPVHYAITGKFRLAPPFREAGQFWPARVDDDLAAAVTGLAGRAIAALGITSGLVHSEIKLTPAGPRIIEINGRMGGLQPDLADRACGLDLIRLAADIALGRPVTLAPIRPDRVYFQLYNPGPTAHGTLLSSTGAAEVRRLPGVTRHRAVARASDPVGGTATNILDITFGDVADHSALADLVRDITQRLNYEFMVDGTVITRTAAHVRAFE